MALMSCLRLETMSLRMSSKLSSAILIDRFSGLLSTCNTSASSRESICFLIHGNVQPSSDSNDLMLTPCLLKTRYFKISDLVLLPNNFSKFRIERIDYKCKVLISIVVVVLQILSIVIILQEIVRWCCLLLIRIEQVVYCKL